MPSNDMRQAGSGFAPATTELAVNVTSAGGEGEVKSAGAQNSQPQPEGGGPGRDDGVARRVQGGQNQFTPGGRATGYEDELACLQRENPTMLTRMDVQAED